MQSPCPTSSVTRASRLVLAALLLSLGPVLVGLLGLVGLVGLNQGCGGSAPAVLGAIGSDCLVQRDSGCATGLCLVLDSGTAYCSQACQGAADCPANFLCLPGGGAKGSVCQARGAGGVCAADADCPAGLRCDGTAGRCYIPVSRSACGPCTSDKQCGAGGLCHVEGLGDSFCAAACGSSDSCAAGYSCKADSAGKHCEPTGGSCRGGRPLCAPCSGDLECGGPGDLCVRNLQSQETFCAVHCATKSDCPTHFSCQDLSGTGAGPSQCIPDSATCSGYCDSADPAAVARECGLGSTCDLTNHLCARATDGSLCAVCGSDDDCVKSAASSRCVVNRSPGSPFAGERFCGSDCTQGTCTGAGCAADPGKCGAGFSCAGIGANGTRPFQCVPVSGSCQGGFGRLGDSCDRHGAADCASSLCAQFGTEHRCSLSCASDSACGDARWRCCAAVGTSRYDCTRPAGPGGGVCAPVGGSFGADCAPGSPPCQEGLCLDLGTAQLCTRACDNSHACDAGFSCQGGSVAASDGSASTTVQVCFPDGGGEVGSACAFGPAACKSHLCLKKDSGNLCTQTCQSAADCPATWSCAPELLPSSSQELVCVPPGSGP